VQAATARRHTAARAVRLSPMTAATSCARGLEPAQGDPRRRLRPAVRSRSYTRARRAPASGSRSSARLPQITAGRIGSRVHRRDYFTTWYGHSAAGDAAIIAGGIASRARIVYPFASLRDNISRGPLTPGLWLQGCGTVVHRPVYDGLRDLSTLLITTTRRTCAKVLSSPVKKLGHESESRATGASQELKHSRARRPES